MIVNAVKVVSWFFIAAFICLVAIKKAGANETLIEYGMKTRNADTEIYSIVVLAVVLILVEILGELQKLNARFEDGEVESSD